MGPVIDDVREAPLVVPDGNVNRAQQIQSDADRISALEKTLAELQAALAATKPKAPHGFLRNGDVVPDVSHPYENPREYPVTMVLATGEMVGGQNFQSTSHWSRIMRQDVPVVQRITNLESEAA
jgi:hypothetical protein